MRKSTVFILLSLISASNALAISPTIGPSVSSDGRVTPITTTTSSGDEVLLCSGVFIREDVVLSAMHCFCATDGWNEASGTCQDGTDPRFFVKQVPGLDLALLMLPTVGTAPLACLNNAPFQEPQTLLAVGYGPASLPPFVRTEAVIGPVSYNDMTLEAPGFACRGDSGGGVFTTDGSDNRLLGIMHSIKDRPDRVGQCTDPLGPPTDAIRITPAVTAVIAGMLNPTSFVPNFNQGITVTENVLMDQGGRASCFPPALERSGAFDTTVAHVRNVEFRINFDQSKWVELRDYTTVRGGLLQVTFDQTRIVTNNGAIPSFTNLAVTASGQVSIRRVSDLLSRVVVTLDPVFFATATPRQLVITSLESVSFACPEGRASASAVGDVTTPIFDIRRTHAVNGTQCF